MQRYCVDLSSLSPSEREEACELLSGFSHFIERIIGKNGLEAVIVNWTSPNNFESSSVFPKGCPCVRLFPN